VKPHGALYNRVLDDAAQATALCEAMTRYGGNLPLLTLPGSVAAHVAASAGITVLAEGFADRTYTEAGRLVPRGEPGAVLNDPADVAAHALQLVQSGQVQSVCIHGDSPGAVEAARATRTALEQAGVRIQAFA
jgi:UPF0271 protein